MATTPWSATCKHAGVIASSDPAAPTALCAHTDVSLADCSCFSRAVNQVLQPAAGSSVSPDVRPDPGHSIGLLGSLYKGITIIRCLITPSAVAICLDAFTCSSYRIYLRTRALLSSLTVSQGDRWNALAFASLSWRSFVSRYRIKGSINRITAATCSSFD